MAPTHRRRGVGRLLIQDLVDRAKTEGWARVCWHTEGDNPARRLYDEFVAANEVLSAIASSSAALQRGTPRARRHWERRDRRERIAIVVTPRPGR